MTKRNVRSFKIRYKVFTLYLQKRRTLCSNIVKAFISKFYSEFFIFQLISSINTREIAIYNFYSGCIYSDDFMTLLMS